MRSQALSAMAALFVLVASACADHKIVGDRNPPTYAFASLKVDTNAAVSWKVYPPPIKKEVHGKVLIFAGNPGVVYTVYATVIDFDAKTFDEAEAAVTFGGGPVPPGPVPPGPSPTPDPPKPDPAPPVAGKLFVVVVEETRQAMAERGAWFADKELSAYMKDKGHKFRVVDKDVQNSDGQTPADVKRFIDDAKKEGTPRLYLVGEDGKTRRAGPMAKTPAELLSLIKQYGG